jgi:cell division protein FtsN
MTRHSQRGGTFLGFIIGLVLGLGVALAVAIYVTKVPTPFSNKNQPRSNDQDVQETQKNKDWNPNNVFQPKSPAATTAPVPPGTDAVANSSNNPTAPTADAGNDKATSEAPKSEPRPAVTADPLGDLAKSKSGLSTPAAPAATAGSGSAVDPFDYVVQVGAYRTSQDADAQKAKLALIGLDAKVSEREQAGRTVFRVRLGPFSDKAAAERVRTRLEGSGIDNTLVRVQR